MRETRLFALGIILILAVLALTLSGCDSLAPEDTTREVRLEAVGGADSSVVTYTNSTGGTTFETVALPFEVSYTAEKGDFVTLLAWSSTPHLSTYVHPSGSWTITARVYVDGEKFAEQTSKGNYVAADVSGTIP